MSGERVSEDDRRHVDWAVAQAKKRSKAADISIFDFLRDILDLEGGDRLCHKGPVVDPVPPPQRQHNHCGGRRGELDGTESSP